MDGIKQALYDVADWLVAQLVKFLDLIFNALIDFINLLISALGVLITTLVSVFPTDQGCLDCPVIPDAPVAEIINFINWLLPVDVLACLTAAIIANYIIYFTVGRVLKFVQVA